MSHEYFQNILGKPVIQAVQAYDDLIVELENEDAVRELKISGSALAEVECRGIIITAKGNGTYDFVSRFFAPKVGVDEDPVTSSAHCKLAHYWDQKFQKGRFLACQASERGGVLDIEVIGERVLLSGNAVTVLTGSLNVDSK